MTLELALLAAYCLGLVVFGALISRKVRQASDFLVAGRSLGPGLLFATFLAANIGAGSTVGAAGIAYEFGMSAWWWVGSAGLGSLVLANLVGPRLWRLSREHGLDTMGDFLELRFDGAVRGVVAGLLWVGTLAILAGQLIAIATILEAVIGIPRWQGATAGGIVVMAYFAGGGLLTAARVNVVQLIVMVVGFLAALGVSLDAIGGFEGLSTALEENRAESFTRIDGIGVRGILAYMVILVPSFIVSPGLVQKLYGARNERAVRIGINLNAICLLVFAFVPTLFGMIGRARFPDLANPEAALPTVMIELLPAGIGLLALAAILSAELSTCDAILFMLSTSLGVDLYKRFLRPGADERRLLMVSRFAAVSGGAAAIVLALVLESIISALTIFYGLMAVALFVPTLFGLYSRYGSARAALETVLASVAGTLLVFALTEGAGFGILTPYAIGILCALAWMGIRTWVERNRKRA
jgi:SSS family solute:Na+ symporter